MAHKLGEHTLVEAKRVDVHMFAVPFIVPHTFMLHETVKEPDTYGELIIISYV